MKKGFTLVELIAVIVILAIAALISTPIIMNVINNVKLNNYRNSMYGLLRAVEEDHTSSGAMTSEYVIVDGVVDPDIEFTGDISGSNGTITYDENVEYFKINTLPQDNILNSINSYFDKIPSASELSFVDSNKRNVIYHTSSEGDNYRGTKISYNNYGTKSLSISFVDKDRFALGGNFACRARCILAF